MRKSGFKLSYRSKRRILSLLLVIPLVFINFWFVPYISSIPRKSELLDLQESQLILLSGRSWYEGRIIKDTYDYLQPDLLSDKDGSWKEGDLIFFFFADDGWVGTTVGRNNDAYTVYLPINSIILD